MDMQQIGPYRLESLLGRGGMGEVYRAVDERLGRRVAVKRLLSDGHSGNEPIMRFRREAKALARLQHPSIVQIFDVLQEDSGDWIVMEWVDGTDLRQSIDDGPLAPEAAVNIGAQIADGLAAAHRHGIVHRDLKTENVLLVDSTVKIVDFGLAQCAGGLDETSLSIPGRVLGTPRAMSPEQAKGKPVDASSDLFSLGVLLYELLAGHSPFKGRSVAETLHRLLSHDPPSVRRFEPRISDRLSTLLERLLDKNPQRRPASAAQVAAELSEIELDTTTGSGGPKTPPTRIAAPTLRQWPTPDLPAEPFPVLLPYSHPALMAGRRRETLRLERLLNMPIPILGLSAPSGTGKSSLLGAGLIPHLRRHGQPVAWIRHPVEQGLATRLAGDLWSEPTRLDTPQDVHEAFAAAADAAGKPVVLIIDQLEELLLDIDEADDGKQRAAQARAELGVLLAATSGRRPGTHAPCCRWLLAYRQEFHGRLCLWLRDVLETAPAHRLDGTEQLPHDFSGPERFHFLSLTPLATPVTPDALDEATEIWLEILETPLALADDQGRPIYPYRFAPGHSRRLARAFAEARMQNPEAALAPELQVVLAHLLDRTAPGTAIEVDDDPHALVAQALESHLFRSLSSVFPTGTADAARDRSRVLLALRELARATGLRRRGMPAEQLARLMGGRHIVEALTRSPARLVTARETADGPRYQISHDAMAATVVEVVEHRSFEGRSDVDTELTALRKLVLLRTELYHRALPVARHEVAAATRLPRQAYRRIHDNAETLICDPSRQAWWRACRLRRRDDRRAGGLQAARILGLPALIITAVAVWLGQVAELERLERRLTAARPGLAIHAFERLHTDRNSSDQRLLTLLRQRDVPMDLLHFGLSGLAADERAPTAVRLAEIALPWVLEQPEDPVLIANLVSALDFASRQPSTAERAGELRRAVLAPLRRLRPPPEHVDDDWALIPAGAFWMGATKADTAAKDTERPQHQVTLSGFRMLRHEVTESEYRRFLPSKATDTELPVTDVTWFEAYAYAAWLGGRLPTEAEWEYAARAQCESAVCDRNGRPTTHAQVAWTQESLRSSGEEELSAKPVMQLEPNAWGLYDMLGNVAEWTVAGREQYTRATLRDPWFLADPVFGRQLRRGGAYSVTRAFSTHTNRYPSPPDSNGDFVGFRVVVPLDPETD